MDTITLRPELMEALKQESRNVNEIVNEAVEQYLENQQSDKLRREITAYEAMHTKLKAERLGMWVAIHNGQLVDEDIDGSALRQRVHAQYGNMAVLIRQVQAQPNRVIWTHTPSTGKAE